MELIRGIQNLTEPVKHPVITIGNFDGVHLGHAQIIQCAIQKAKARGGDSIVFTFRPHPQVALRPAVELQLLSTYDEKIELFNQAGIDWVIEEPFSREFSIIEPQQFFMDILIRRLSAESIVVGYDFAFGKERHGHLEALEAFCKKASVELTIVPPHRVESEVVSSSRIRHYLLNGEIEIANRLLGRQFFYRGFVMKGEGRGRKLGFPTANLKLENKLVLPYGVYATWAELGGQLFPSVTNVGVRPTFHEAGKELPALVETHLLNTTMDLYGSKMEVRFVKRIRDEKKFINVEQLKLQILADANTAESFLKST